ncbi:MAG: hypothetical protein WA667_00240 [Candidatus Nitrosopolaris sp.]
MQFEEQFLTDKKGDENHCRTVSFRNCMLRIPGSLNSKRIQFNDKDEIIGDIPPEAEVMIIQRWDGNKPSIRSLLTPYYIWLQAQQLGIYRDAGCQNRNLGNILEKIRRLSSG